MSTNDFGKKVFFLYPHSVIEFDLIQTLIEEEYEVYILKDYKKVKLLMQKYKDSILFINIDEVLNEQEWYEYTQNLIESTRDFNTQIGILTYNENQDLTQKYLMDLGVTCGFIQLKLGKEESKKIILKTLEINESKGKRKYIRATSLTKISSSFNVQINSDIYTGIINDISSAGMSCIFDKEIEFKKNTLLRKIQLKLGGKLAMADGIVFGSRQIEKNKKLMVILFTNNISDDSKFKIHEYIKTVLQSNINKEIADIYG